MYFRTLQLAAVSAAVAALTACGGGGSGGDAPVIVTAFASGTASTELSVQPGEQFSFTAQADSADRALTSLKWAMLASGGAPALSVNNADCQVINKTDTPGINGLVHSNWSCTIAGRAPLSVGADTSYAFTASAVNSKAASANASTTLKVIAPKGEAANPVVSLTSVLTAEGGTKVPMACAAEGGFLATGSTYKFAWTSDVVDKLLVTFDDNTKASVSATLPTVTKATTFLVSCKVTDSASHSTTKSIVLEVTPAAVKS